MSDTPAWYSCWKDLFAQIGHRADRLLSRQDLSDQEIAEGLRQQMRLALVALTWRIENSNMDFPIFQRMNDNRAGGCAANSDITYLRAQIHGDRTYRIHGEPGEREFCIYLATGDFSVLDDEIYLGERWSHELDLNTDGSVDVIIGGAQLDRNWLPLHAGEPCWVAVRQYFRDWHDETIPGFFSIDCIDGPLLPTALTTSEMTERLQEALRWWQRARRRVDGRNEIPTGGGTACYKRVGDSGSPKK